MIDLPRMQAAYAWGRLGALHPDIDDVRALMQTVEALSTACRALVTARLGGADVYEASNEVDDIERALAVMDGVADKVCGVCGAPWAPEHWHLEQKWMAANE